MVCRVISATVEGISGKKVIVETHLSMSLPCIKVVGLPDKAVEDARERIMPAIKNSGYSLRPMKITINLAPSYVHKRGTSLDLPIAISVLGAHSLVNVHNLEKILIVGELSLDGKLRYTNGLLQAIDLFKREHLKYCIIPRENANELPDMGKCMKQIILADSLSDVVAFINDEKLLDHAIAKKESSILIDSSSFFLIKGNKSLKRIGMICIAGMHNLIMMGPPGVGKTLIAKSIRSIAPRMTSKQIHQTAMIYSAAKARIPKEILAGIPPFRSPHHSISEVALLGGGTYLQPGEISLAHNGILFLDEITCFKGSVLNALREPIEEHCINITRSGYSTNLPSKFLIIAAMNPCKCGNRGDPTLECKCKNSDVRKYLSKISGALYDRFDLQAFVLKPGLTNYTNNEQSQKVYNDIIQARNIQALRFKNTKIEHNAYISHEKIEQYCPMTNSAIRTLKLAYQEIPLSMRGYLKVIRVARTIADLEGKEIIANEHIAEAISYRTSLEV